LRAPSETGHNDDVLGGNEMAADSQSGEIATYPSLRGKTVLVTGGGSGIGAAITRRFAQQGSKTAFIDIAEKPSAALVAELADAGRKVHFESADLRDIAALRRAIENIRAAYGPIDILINNAAHDERHVMADVTPEYWDDRIAVNLRHQFFCAQAVLPEMVAKKAGVIVNFGSVAWMVGTGDLSVYIASKSAVLGLTRSIAREYGPHNVRCLAIAPGWIMTERQRTLWVTPEAEKLAMQNQCVKRLLQPDEMARAALFFASDEASALTNQQYIADGGWA
jgi:NAD(P)-dependent dehydrogenase (short-subunit alcohol dehydrogenase family)